MIFDQTHLSLEEQKTRATQMKMIDVLSDRPVGSDGEGRETLISSVIVGNGRTADKRDSEGSGWAISSCFSSSLSSSSSSDRRRKRRKIRRRIEAKINQNRNEPWRELGTTGGGSAGGTSFF